MLCLLESKLHLSEVLEWMVECEVSLRKFWPRQELIPSSSSLLDQDGFGSGSNAARGQEPWRFGNGNHFAVCGCY